MLKKRNGHLFALVVATLFCTFIFFKPPATVFATDYYLSPSGDDTNTGTSFDQAWKSISRANLHSFQPADQLYLESGQHFAGELTFEADDQGSPSQPITITTTGPDRAIIDATNTNGITIYNSAGFTISNLSIQGSDITQKSGLLVYADTNNSTYDHISIANCEISGFSRGIEIGSWNQSTGFINVTVENNHLYDNGNSGISSFAEIPYTHQNITVIGNDIHDIVGISTTTTGGSGNGIVLGDVTNALIENNKVYNNGSQGNGNVGIWVYNTNQAIIQYNQSHHNKTFGGVDGGGFGLDGGTTNSIMQYNYSHDNEGAGYGLFQYTNAPHWQNNIIRYNISENDGLKNGYGSISLWTDGGLLENAVIHNNTIFQDSTPLNPSPAALKFLPSSAPINAIIANNIFVTPTTTIHSDANHSQTMIIGNNYFSPIGTPSVDWDSQSYASIQDWSTATGLEIFNGQFTAITTDPLLQNPGNHGQINTLDELVGYQLTSASPLINQARTFGIITYPDADFFSTPIPQGNNPDIGIHEKETDPADADGDFDLDFVDYKIFISQLISGNTLWDIANLISQIGR